MRHERLLGLHGITFRTPDRIEVEPIHLQLYRRDKILLRCGSDTIYDTFVAVVTGQLPPLSGHLDEMRPVRVQTDRHLLQSIDPNRTIRELVKDAHLPDSIWLGQRRRSLFGTMDRLGIESRHFRLPIKMEPRAVLERFWALRFLMSRADLLVGRELFALEDSGIREVLRLRWDDFNAAVIYAGPEDRIPGPPDVVLTLAADGQVQLEEIVPPAESEGSPEPGPNGPPGSTGRGEAP